MTALATVEAEPVALVRARRRPWSGLGVGGWISVVILAVALLMAVFGPLLVSASPTAVNLAYAYVRPISGHWLGFDGQGRDLLARLVYGARTAIIGPLVVTVLSTVAGTAIALVAVWRGGWLDTALARVVDAMFAFPGLLLAILAVSLFGRGLTAAGIALAIAYTPYAARLVRGAALRERALPYVSALTVQGFRATTIVLRHILPNLTGIIVAGATLSYGYSLIDLAGLSFIGLGVQPPTADWGAMVASGVPGILQHYPEESLYASLCIVLVVGAVNYLGDRLTTRAEAAR